MCYILTWMYNDLGGADQHFLTRNLLNAAAYLVYGSGALHVFLGEAGQPLQEAYHWLAMVSAVIFTTMQIQDLKDQAGDKARNRRTIPLVLGDRRARWTIVIGVIFWSLVCPVYWNLGFYAFTAPVLLGCTVAWRVTWLKTWVADCKSYQLWSIWLTVIFLLPVVSVQAAQR